MTAAGGAASGGLQPTPDLGDGELFRVRAHGGGPAAADITSQPPSTRVFFVNGIQTDAGRAIGEATQLAVRLGTPVDLVYVGRQATLAADVERAYAETMLPEVGKTFAPERTLTQELITALEEGQTAHVVAAGRGAIVAQLALENVRTAYATDGRSPEWIVEHALGRVSVETRDGASRAFPEGVRAEHRANPSALLDAGTIGAESSPDSIRDAAIQVIDTSLAALSLMTPEQRGEHRVEAGTLLGDAVRLEATTQQAVLAPAEATRDLQRVRGELAALLSADGATRPPRADRTPPAAEAPESLEKRVAKAMPEQGGRGGKLPDLQSIVPWDGKTRSGTMFRVDESTYAIHVGRGDVQTVDIASDIRGAQPPNGAYVDLLHDGRVMLDPSMQRGRPT